MFLFRNPLKREISPGEMHRIRESTPHAGLAFLGVSLLNRQPCFIQPGQYPLTVVSGANDYQGVEVVISILREVVERSSILLLNVTGIDENWHKGWAMAFNYDRAGDFCLFDFEREERSDYLAMDPLFPHPHLFKNLHPVDVPQVLGKKKGMVALHAGAEKTHQGWAVDLAGRWFHLADFVVIIGAQRLAEEVLKSLPVGSEKKLPPVILVQTDPISGSSPPSSLQVLFRQRNAMTCELWDRILNLCAGTPYEKGLKVAGMDLHGLTDTQSLVLQPDGDGPKVDLIQIASGDGLPWPPEYRPHRIRHPGT